MGIKMKYLIILLLTSLPFSVLAQYSHQEDIAYEMAAIQVSMNCKEQGKTDVSVNPQDAITMGVNKTNLSRQQVLNIIQRRSTQDISDQYVSNMTNSIKSGRISCADIVLFTIGGLMQK